MAPIILGEHESQSFVLKVGDLDLAQYLRAQAGEGFDPSDVDYSEPQFSRSPARAGGSWVGDNVNLRELVWPLSLDATNKDGLLEVIREINLELEREGIRVEWRDAGASQSTFYDIARGRLEPEFNFWRAAAMRINAILRIWVQPFGHTATERIVGTGAASGPVAIAPLAALQGDAPGLLDLTVRAGAAPSHGRIVAAAVLPHPFYAPEIRAASIGDRMDGAAIVGASGAPGSQYLGLPVSPTCASGIACKLELFAASAYAGRQRVFALARSKLSDGVALRALDPFGQPIGPTALATVSADWGLVDLGVLSLSERRPTQVKLALVAGGGPSGAVVGSPGLQLGAGVVLPERSAALIEDVGAGGSLVAGDTFTYAANLAGHADEHGNTWRLGRSEATGGLRSQLSLANATVTQTLFSNYIDEPIADSVAVAQHHGNYYVPEASGFISVKRDINASNWIMGHLQRHPSRVLSLLSLTNGATTVHASQAFASLPPRDISMRLGLRTLGGRGDVTLHCVDGQPLALAGGATVAAASIGASHADLDRSGEPALSGWQATLGFVYVRDFAVHTIPSSPLRSGDLYRLSGLTDDAWRQASGADITGLLTADMRGAVPQAPPSSPRVAAMVLPSPEGPANDVCSVEVRISERFRFAR